MSKPGHCRVCTAALEEVLDLGTQCIAGQFPAQGEPDPPRYPLVLCSCPKCGLVQLHDTVHREQLFRNYGYQSRVSQTMRDHLIGIAQQARHLSGNPMTLGRVLDIGCNDGSLLAACYPAQELVGIDPSNVADAFPEYKSTRIKGFFPDDLGRWSKFNLIFSIACFYDSDDPVAFARAVRDCLVPGGIWCLEVADVRATLGGAWDSILHEHLLYLDLYAVQNILSRAGLYCFRSETNSCNGGSLRCWCQRSSHVSPDQIEVKDFDAFRQQVWTARGAITSCLTRAKREGKRVHLLGASTKANTWLQFCGVDNELIQAASDRDPLKVGRRTPGSGIPIVSEEESRAMKPDVYVCGPWSFRTEILEREKAFLAGGGQIVFPLPTLEVVG